MSFVRSLTQPTAAKTLAVGGSAATEGAGFGLPLNVSAFNAPAPVLRNATALSDTGAGGLAEYRIEDAGSATTALTHLTVTGYEAVNIRAGEGLFGGTNLDLTQMINATLSLDVSGITQSLYLDARSLKYSGGIDLHADLGAGATAIIRGSVFDDAVSLTGGGTNARTFTNLGHGADLFDGRGANTADTVIGGSGADTLLGGAGNDMLFGDLGMGETDMVAQLVTRVSVDLAFVGSEAGYRNLVGYYYTDEITGERVGRLVWDEDTANAEAKEACYTSLVAKIRLDDLSCAEAKSIQLFVVSDGGDLNALGGNGCKPGTFIRDTETGHARDGLLDIYEAGGGQVVITQGSKGQGQVWLDLNRNGIADAGDQLMIGQTSNNLTGETGIKQGSNGTGFAANNKDVFSATFSEQALNAWGHDYTKNVGDKMGAKFKDLGAGSFDITQGQTDTQNGLVGFEDLYGGKKADKFDRDFDDAVLSVKVVCETAPLSANPGNDTLKGGDGNDILDGGPGADHLQGDADTGSFRLTPIVETVSGPNLLRSPSFELEKYSGDNAADAALANPDQTNDADAGAVSVNAHDGGWNTYWEPGVSTVSNNVIVGWDGSQNGAIELQFGHTGGLDAYAGNTKVELDSDVHVKPDGSILTNTHPMVYQRIFAEGPSGEAIKVLEADKTYTLKFAFAERQGEGDGSSDFGVYWDNTDPTNNLSTTGYIATFTNPTGTDSWTTSYVKAGFSVAIEDVDGTGAWFVATITGLTPSATQNAALGFRAGTWTGSSFNANAQMNTFGTFIDDISLTTTQQRVVGQTLQTVTGGDIIKPNGDLAMGDGARDLIVWNGGAAAGDRGDGFDTVLGFIVGEDVVSFDQFAAGSATVQTVSYAGQDSTLISDANWAAGTGVLLAGVTGLAIGTDILFV